MMRYSFVIFSLLLLIIVLSCSRRPNNVLNKDEMTKVVKDMWIAKAMMEHKFDSPEKQKAITESVLDKYGLTEKEFEASIEWYSDNPNEYFQVIDSISVQLRRESEVFRMLDNTEILKHSIKNIPSYFFLTHMRPRFTFKVDSTEIQNSKQDKYFFSYFVQGLSDSTKIESCIYYIFSDTTIFEKTLISQNNYCKVIHPNNPKGTKLKSVSGYFYLNNSLNDVPVVIYNFRNMGSEPQDINTNGGDFYKKIFNE